MFPDLWWGLSFELILVLLGIGALLAYLVGRALEKYNLGKISSGGVTLAVLGFAVFLLLFAPSSSSSFFIFSDFARYVGVVILSCSFLVSLASLGYSEIEYYPEFFALLMASTLGMIIIPLADNLLLLYAGWELMSIPAYVMVALKTKREESTEAAMKYFIFGAISSILILYGMSIFYGEAGTLIISELSGQLTGKWKAIEYIGLITLTAGFGIKVGVVPFHMWIPDTYTGGPVPTSTFLTTSSKNAGFGAIAKVMILGLTINTFLNFEVRMLLAILAVITMIGGNLFALAQKNIIRMLSYSSITHSGYILVGMVVATSNQNGLTASLFHLFTYSISDIAAFICAAFFLVNLRSKTLSDYEGIGQEAKFASFTMTFALFSLAGVPGLAGFASKFALFFAGINGKMLWLSIALALNSAFSFGYYGRLIKRMYLHERKKESESPIQLPKTYAIVFIITIVLIIIMGVFPSFFLTFAENGTQAFFPSP